MELDKDLIYLYCVTNIVPKLKEAENLVDTSTSLSVNPERSRGIDKLYFVYHQGLYAVVSKVKESEFSEENLRKNLANLEWIKEKANMHEKIIEGVMRNTCVIPFKFGTIFNTEDNLKAMLEEHAEELMANLKNLEGKEEWGIKVYCDMEKLKEAIGKEETEVLKIEEEIKSSSTGKAYLLKKKKEELIKDAVNKRINEYGQESFEILKGLSLRARINKLLPKEVTEREDEMILNAAFLVDKSKVAEFVQAVGGLKAKYTGKGFNFNCTGPWPPYNFTTIKEEV